MFEAVYRPAEEKDQEQVVELLREHFYTDEPLHKYAGEYDPEDEDFAVGLIKNGLSTVAEVNEQIVGVRLAFASHKDSRTWETYRNTKPETAFQTIMGFVNALEEKGDVFNKFQVETVLQGHVLCVHNDFRGKGIARRLYEENMEMVKLKGFSVYVCDCTSLFSAKLCEKLGMQQTASMEFHEYCDDNGNAFYVPEPPHDLARSYAKRL